MNLSREITTKLRQIFDDWLPPRLHDSKLVMGVLFRFLFGNQSEVLMSFKDGISQMNDREFDAVYEKIKSVAINRKTDLNKRSFDAVYSAISGKTILEVGCGWGFLSKRIAGKFKLVATDIIIDDKLRKKMSTVKFVVARAENLPFPAQKFDTVISTHVLEHVPNIYLAVAELKRVTRNRLIVVVPRQRPFWFTPDLHLHFFPYKYQLQLLFDDNQTEIKQVDGDWLVVWERTKTKG